MTRSSLLTVYARETIGFPHLAGYFSLSGSRLGSTLPPLDSLNNYFQAHRRTESSELWANRKEPG
jgi:hypothetical protein